MLRDLTMIFAVLASVVSVGFGVYKNIEAGNAKGFAYEQAYRIMNAVQDANISSGAKANILDTALGSLSTPPPVIDLSRSSADVGTPETCTETKKASCASLATSLGQANAVCTRSKGVGEECDRAGAVKADIRELGCFTCYAH